MYNKVFMIGNLTRDPEMRATTAGIPVCHFALAVNRIGKDGGVDFFNIVAWRRLAEICGEFLKKGSPVAVEGRLQVRSYQGKDGGAKTMTEIVIDNMQMLGRKGDSSATPAAPNAVSINEAGVSASPNEGEEIPF